jgi:hypothetical protein
MGGVTLRNLSFILAGLLMLAACNQQVVTPPEKTNHERLFEELQKEGLAPKVVEVQANLPTQLPLVIVGNVVPENARPSSPRPGQGYVWVLDGFLTQAMAVHYSPESGPVILGMAAVYPWETRVEITPESTALYLILHATGIDWTRVLDPAALGFSQGVDPDVYARQVIERVQQAVRSSPQFPQLVQELDRLIRNGQSFLDVLVDPVTTQGGISVHSTPQKLLGYVQDILFDHLFSGRPLPLLQPNLAVRLFNIAFAQDGNPIFNFNGGGVSASFGDTDTGELVLENNLPVPIAAGALSYETEVDSGQYDTALEKDVLSYALSSTPSAKLRLGSGRFLACALAGTPLAGTSWLPDSNFPLQNLFAKLQTQLLDEVLVLGLARTVGLIPLLGKAGKVPKVLDAAGKAIGGVKILYDIQHDGLDPAKVASTLKLFLSGINIDDKELQSQLTALSAKVSALDEEIALLEAARKSAIGSDWQAKGALWKSPEIMAKYGPEMENFFKGLGLKLNEKAVEYEYKDLKVKVLHPDLRTKAARDAFVRFFEAKLAESKLAKSTLESAVSALKLSSGIKQTAKTFLELLPLIDYADFALWALGSFTEHYVCFDVNTQTKTIRRTTVPNLLVTPTEISNGKKDEPYTFQLKVLHILRKGGRDKLTLSWNFGDGTAGQRDIIATRSPHTESLTHAYSNAGAYGALFQVASVSGRASQVVPVYIELPKNENNYNLNICDVWRAANSGGYGVTEDLWDISVIRPPSGQKAVFDISFDTYFIPDRIFVYYPPGNLVLDTGWRGDPSYEGDPLYPGGIAGPGRGQFDNIFEKGSVDQFKVVVVGPDRDTAWTYSVRCRFVQSSSQPQALGITLEPREVPLDPEALRQFPVLKEGR